MIEIKNVTKQFKNITALEHMNLTFQEKHIYGLLGRNGAGKSTLLNLITNRIFPTTGTVLVDGRPCFENDVALGKIFYMSENMLYEPSVRLSKLFYWTSLFYPKFDMDYADSLSKKFGLAMKQKIGQLSTGYQSILKLILTLASGADYLLFDEPVLGLDANHRQLFYEELIARYSDYPCTIVLSTHLIEEVASLIEHVVIIKEGRLLLERPTEEMHSMGYTISGKSEDVDSWCAGKNILDVQQLGGLKIAFVLGEKDEIPTGLTVTPLDLQQLFIHLTNA